MLKSIRQSNEAMKPEITIFWFRRDLRTHDNAGLYRALSTGKPVVPVFIFDRNILSKLDDKSDMRVNFIHERLEKLQKKLAAGGGGLLAEAGEPEKIFEKMINRFNVVKVIANHDYEPYAQKRDDLVRKLLRKHGIPFETYKDQVIFEKDEVLSNNGDPYTVYTPYMKKWKSQLEKQNLKPFDSGKLMGQLCDLQSRLPSLEAIGFEKKKYDFPSDEPDIEVIRNYHLTRDIPFLDGTTRLGVHLRFGTISIRELVKIAANMNEIFLNELIWREFFMMILWHFPEVVDNPFRKKYEKLQWRNNEKEFDLWKAGETGYPIVDAAMHQLNQSGYMHNRLRMVTAGFLTKHLLIDWRWGEAWFAEKLLDYELSSNNGNWQWAAGTGCDAAPWFRIFNPVTQQKKFDPDLKFIKEWIRGFREENYIEPVVEHTYARKRALQVFKKASQ